MSQPCRAGAQQSDHEQPGGGGEQTEPLNARSTRRSLPADCRLLRKPRDVKDPIEDKRRKADFEAAYAAAKSAREEHKGGGTLKRKECPSAHPKPRGPEPRKDGVRCTWDEMTGHWRIGEGHPDAGQIHLVERDAQREAFFAERNADNAAEAEQRRADSERIDAEAKRTLRETPTLQLACDVMPGVFTPDGRPCYELSGILFERTITPPRRSGRRPEGMPRLLEHGSDGPLI